MALSHTNREATSGHNSKAEREGFTLRRPSRRLRIMERTIGVTEIGE